ncbi:MAG: hypothetical protein GY797_05970 [Deltaproteobacteria bacterium]|nr:hypothetical protein [Deltaproteobacteria bacterium]
MENVSQNALAIFRFEKVMTLDRLAKLLDSSTRTAQRRLKEWRAYRSYNKNGRYYVLPRNAEFDSSGIWKCNDIFFSEHGNLRDTLFYFIDRADAGLSAAELSHLLGLPAYSFLSRYNQNWDLPKEKYQGVYMYFSKDRDISEEQRRKREARVRSQATEKLPCDVHSIVILTELIKHPGTCVEDLARRVRRKGIAVGIGEVRNLLIHHDLLKKTLVFQPSGP